MAAPNSTPSQIPKEWEPVVPYVQLAVERALRTTGPDAFYMAIHDVVPDHLSEHGEFSDFVDATRMRGAGRGAIVQIVASNRTSSRRVAMLFFERRGRLDHRFVTELMPFGGRLLNDTSAYASGGRIGFAGSDMVQGTAGVGRMGAVVLELAKGDWRRIASRQTTDSAGADAVAGPGGIAFTAKLYARQGKVIRDNSTIPCFETDERWVVERGRLVTVSRRPLENCYWAADGLVQALRRRDVPAASRFVASPDVLKTVVISDFWDDGRPIASTGEGRPKGLLGLQIDGRRANGKSYAYGLAFRNVNGRSVITGIEKYL